MKHSRSDFRWIFWTLAAGAVLLAVLPDSEAVPAFARRYETSCATCHQAFPRLNAVGDSFRISGFRFVDDERYRKSEPVEMGDEAYKRLWPKALWPSDIPRRSPLSIISRFMVEQDLDGSRPESTTMLLPEEIELVWAGNLGEDMVFYGDVIYLQKDFGGGDPDSWATLKAWLQFQNLFGVDRLAVRVGSVGTQTMGLFTARDANFYGTHFYLYTQWVMPEPNLAEAGLTDYKGNYFTIIPQAGIELNRYGRRWFWAAGVVNGAAEVSPAGRPESDITFFGMGQGSGVNDFYGHFAYKVGGVPFDRSREPPGDALSTGAEFWRDDSLTFSLYGYRGTAEIRTVDLAGTEWLGEDDFWRLGFGVQKQIGDWSLSAAYVVGENDDPYGNLSDDPVDSTAWHLEALVFAYPWLIPYARYEGLEIDVPTDVPGLDPQQDIERIVAGAKFLIRPNVAAIVERAATAPSTRRGWWGSSPPPRRSSPTTWWCSPPPTCGGSSASSPSSPPTSRSPSPTRGRWRRWRRRSSSPGPTCG
jgi:hypothetical protein